MIKRSKKRSIKSNEKFIIEQKKYYKTALKEIKNGKKETHWIWYILPNTYSEKTSETSKFYSIKNLEESVEYLENKYLRKNLLNMFRVIVHKLESIPMVNLMNGNIDANKLINCAKLFMETCKFMIDNNIGKSNKMKNEIIEILYLSHEILKN